MVLPIKSINHSIKTGLTILVANSLQFIGTLHNISTTKDDPLQHIVLGSEGNGSKGGHAVDNQLTSLTVFHHTQAATALVGSIRRFVLAGALQALICLFVDFLQLTFADLAELAVLYDTIFPLVANAFVCLQRPAASSLKAINSAHESAALPQAEAPALRQ